MTRKQTDMARKQNDKYYWVNRASEHHINRMLTLAPATQLQGDLMGVAAPQYMMCRSDVLLTPDGRRRYELLIEYDIYNPSQGIYFGCKSITLPGYNHQEEIGKAMVDWRTVCPHVLQRLNNVFIDKDFTHRFKDTDNDNDNTFWPFWITLYEDEDPREVGMRALRIIAGVYRQLFDGTLADLPAPPEAKEKRLTVRTAFTEDAYLRLRDTVKHSIKHKATADRISSLPDDGWNLFLTILKGAEAAGIIIPTKCYERGWTLSAKQSDVDFKCMMQSIFTYLGEQLGIEEIRVPWNDLLALFMRSDGSRFKMQVKTLPLTHAKKNHWAATIPTLVTNAPS